MRPKPCGTSEATVAFTFGGADQINQHVAGGVVAEDDHLLQQIANGKRRGQRVAIGRASAIDIVGRAQAQCGVEREGAGVNTLQYGDGHRHLDHRGDVPAFIGPVTHRCVAAQLAHIHTDFRLVARCYHRKLRRQVLAPRGWWIGQGFCMRERAREADGDQGQKCQTVARTVFEMKLRQMPDKQVRNRWRRKKALDFSYWRARHDWHVGQRRASVRTHIFLTILKMQHEVH